MEIKAINTYVVEVPLVNEWQISLYKSRTRKHAIVEIITNNGIKGYGEAAPSPAFMGETAETIKLVIEKYLAPPLIGKNVFEIEKINSVMSSTIHSQMSAKSAIDIALYDVVGKIQQVPVYNLIGGKFRDEILLTYVIGMKNLDEVLKETNDVINAGYECIKLKVGKDLDRDIETIKQVYKLIESLEKKIYIRLDGNQGFTVINAKYLLKAIENIVPIESFEQPIPKWDLLGMNDIRKNTSVPIMVDEAVFDLHDAYNVIKMDAADIVNLKICKVGGITGAKKIAGLFEAAGLSCVIGSNLELGIGMAASAHVAASTPNVNMHNDFICGGYLHQDDIVEPSYYNNVKNGRIIVEETIGLGSNLKNINY